MANADYFASGQWNFYCDFCGRKGKSSDAMKTWNGFYVCRHHKEARNPQDFLKGVREQQAIPWSRPDPLGRISANAILDTTSDPILDNTSDPILDTNA